MEREKYTGKKLNRDSSCGNSKPLPAFLILLYPAMVGSSSLWSRKLHNWKASIHDWTIIVHFVTGFGNSTTDCVFKLGSQPVVAVPTRSYNIIFNLDVKIFLNNILYFFFGNYFIINVKISSLMHSISANKIILLYFIFNCIHYFMYLYIYIIMPWCKFNFLM